MRPSTFLPAIKCSDCGREIEISLMGEHVCSNTADARTQESARGDVNKASNETASRGLGASLFKPWKGGVPWIDAPSANRSFLGNHNKDASGYPSNPRSASSNTVNRFLPSPAQSPPPRSTTAPPVRPARPPSPEIANLDCPFPPFGMPLSPTADNRSRGPVSNTHNMSSSEQVRAQASPTDLPGTPTSGGGGGVLQRMNTIAPGPFDIQSDRKSRDREQQSYEHGHQRTPTAGSINHHNRSASASKYVGHFARPPRTEPGTPSSLHFPKSNSKSDRSGTGRTRGPVQERTSDSEPRDNLQSSLHFGHDRLFQEPLHLEEKPARRRFGLDQAPSLNESHELISRQRRPSGQEADKSPSRPDHARNDRLAAGYKIPTERSRNTEEEERPAEYPLLSSRSYNDQRDKSAAGGRGARVPNALPHYSIENPYHTPTGSLSSTGSGYVSESKTGSSQSSPPSSDISDRPTKKPSRTANIDNLLNDMQVSVRDFETISKPHEVEKELPSTRRFRHDEAPVPPPKDRHAHSPIARGARSLPSQEATSSRNSNESHGSNSLTVPTGKREQRRPAGAKGKCRGCTETIYGKSVSSSDGRLTGRYHRGCFVCQTCKEPFDTATFYVLDNQPYCERHYHKLNKSLCNSCDKGIEGQYLETEDQQKFHATCFTCKDCHTMLQDDYFEIGGSAYCEMHAFQRARQNAFGSGRRNPERRTTRMMMM